MQEDLSDVDLLANASKGDGQAFGRIFARHNKIVYNYCFRRLGSWSDAEDATSLVFLETWRRRRKAVDLDGSLLPWLIGVANNVVRNMSRASRRYDVAMFRMSHLTAEPDPSDTITERMDDERLAREVIELVSSLNRAEQDVITAVLMAGLTYAEASLTLGVPIGTVRSRLSRARQKLDLELKTRLETPRTSRARN
jgi:RNA polymerase sigma-70 factor (ECF subfamily)